LNKLKTKRLGKIIKYALVGILATGILAYFALAVAVQMPSVQAKMAAWASDFLSSQLQSPVRVGNVGVDLFNRLVLRNVLVEDRNGDTLLTADHISAGVQLIPYIVQRKIIFTDIRLYGFDVRMKRASQDDELNINPLIDAFASQDRTKTTNIDLKINSIQLRHGQISYDVTNMPDTVRKFNSGHIAIHDLNGQIQLNALTADSLAMRIDKLSFSEHTGFKINKLSMNVSGNTDSVAIHNLMVSLPSTSIRIDTANVLYNRSDSLPVSVARASMRLKIAPSQICLKDFAAFVPAFGNFTSIIDMTAEASGFVNDLSFNNLDLRINHTTSVNGSIDIENITRREETYLYGKIDRVTTTAEGLVDLVNHFQKQPIILPEAAMRLGNLIFSGEVSGFVDRLMAFGNLQSDIGALDIDLTLGRQPDNNRSLYLTGNVASTELQINMLFDEGNPYGIARFQAEVDASQLTNGQFSGNLHAQINEMDYNDYRYENIMLAGAFNPNEYNGSIDVDDPNGRLYAEGLFKYDGENSIFDFAADIQNANLQALHITKQFNNPTVSINIAANFTGNTIDLFKGQILANDFAFITKTDSFYLDSLRIDAHESGRELLVSSDLLRGQINGQYSFRTLIPSLMNTAESYLPVLSHIIPPAENLSENAFSFAMQIENTEKLAKTFKLPFSIVEKSEISGEYDYEARQVKLDASLPKYKIGSSNFEDGSVQIMNRDDKLTMNIKTTQINKRKLHNLFTVSSEISDNEINALFSLANAEDKTVDVQIATSTRISPVTEENGKKSLLAELLFLPNKLLIKDSVWNMAPSSVILTDGYATIHDFNISNGRQYLHIDGTVSKKSPAENLTIELNKIELAHIFDIIDIPALQFGGEATGSVSLNHLYETPNIDTELEVKDFSFNQVVQGNLNIFSQWDNDENGIMLLGTIYRDSATWSDVSGYIYPTGKTENISLYFDAKDMDISLLHPYMQAFTKTIEGKGVGNIHLFGNFSNMTFEGNAFVRDGRIGVDVLNTQYTFNDSVVIKPEAIIGRNITVYDKDGNKGNVNFEVNHKFLRDFSFKADIQAQNMMLYNVSDRINPQIYGTVYGSGNARIAWLNDAVTIDANIQNSDNSSMGFNFMNGSSAEDYDFILFKTPDDLNLQTSPEAVKTASNSNNDDDADLRINCFIDVTPSANLELVMDPVSGDKIKGSGSGDIQLRYDSNTDLTMFGGFTVQSGNYNFSLQQVLHKDFKIRDGSRIDFSGNPLDAILNLNASYYMTASIEDLDQALLKETFRTSVPINCILNLNGQLQNPAISFDLEFPNSTNELQRQVKSFIGTEDMMARQIVYLLVLNKFYTPDYSRNDYRGNEFSAVASSALSTQLSSLLNSLTDKVQIGANIRSRQDGVSDTEVEMLLSSQLLDNRLLFNGNFGYKNNFIQTNAFIGEFDLEYKLTPSGEFRLKAYNHANDMYRYTMKSLTRQGVGLMYYKDFDKIGDIFRRRKTVAPQTNGANNILENAY